MGRPNGDVRVGMIPAHHSHGAARKFSQPVWLSRHLQLLGTKWGRLWGLLRGEMVMSPACARVTCENWGTHCPEEHLKTSESREAPAQKSLLATSKDISASVEAADNCSGEISTRSFLLSERRRMMTEWMWMTLMVSTWRRPHRNSRYFDLSRNSPFNSTTTF